MYIFSYGIFSKYKSNNPKKKRKTSKKVINDKRKLESDNIYETKIKSEHKDSKGWKICPNCKKTIRKNNLICPRCGKFIGKKTSSNSKDDEIDCKICPNCNHKQYKTNKTCPNCYYSFED